ncbi:DUF3158 family protein [Pasteurella skyensis]|uniref:DUF3158 family protein n=1 Tax=Phocoenobacter skyensis TaxID=97481 RepID=UPI00276B2D8D|nr:DUF3158 family protein [Pasteurella skyensis]MDP8189094.1 DUF3158 family protein [Pasteurella skyensis]
MNQIYRLIPEDMYKELAQNLNLNHFLRSLFDSLDTVEKYDYLLEEAERIRDGFYDLQPTMTQGIYDNLLVNLPIRFIRDSASRRGATYLRWRNLGNNKSGENAWKNIVTDPNQPKELKDSLLQAEKERITLNMQMAIIAHIIRQLSECKEKISRVEELHQ